MAHDTLRIVFAGTPDFACASLRTLLASRHEVVAVYTQPDRPAGRGRRVSMSPVKEEALRAGLPVFQPATLKTPEAQQELASLAPELMVVVAYGLLLPAAVLSIPVRGCINVHASLLPRWRGAAPIQRAIAAGDRETGITIMQMDVGLDTGDMLHVVHTPIAADDTGGTLHDRLAPLGAQALVDVLDNIDRFAAARRKQDDANATYAHKLSKEDAEIDWTSGATRIIDQVRAFNPWPVAQTAHRDQPLRIWSAVRVDADQEAEPGTITEVSREGVRVACGEGSVRLTQLQLPGGRPLRVADLLNGHPDAFRRGERLSRA